MSNPWVVSMRQAICSFWSGPVMVSRKVLSLASLAASVIDSKRTSLVSLLVKHQGIMVRIGPIDSSIPHRAVPSLQVTFLSPRALILWWQTARLSHHRFRSGTAPGKYELSQSVKPCGDRRLSPACSTVHEGKGSLAPALGREGSL